MRMYVHRSSGIPLTLVRSQIALAIDTNCSRSKRYGADSKKRHFVAKEAIEYMINAKIALDRQHAVHHDIEAIIPS